jgi:hypothetical protein
MAVIQSESPKDPMSAAKAPYAEIPPMHRTQTVHIATERCAISIALRIWNLQSAVIRHANEPRRAKDRKRKAAIG